jgi:hypothetical protein
MIWHNVEHQYTQGNTKTTTRHEPYYKQLRIRRDRHCMVIGFTTICAFIAITTNVVSSNPFMVRCTRYNIM